MLAWLREKLKGWKTVIVNLLIGIPSAALAGLQAFQGVDLTPLFGSWGLKIMTAMTVLGIVLRLATTGPVGSKGETPATVDTKAGD